MPGAEIRFDQAANPIPVGTPGVARDDIWLSQPVVCRSVLSGNTAWQWSFLDVPPGSAAVFSGSTTPTATFTPEKGTNTLFGDTRVTFHAAGDASLGSNNIIIVYGEQQLRRQGLGHGGVVAAAPLDVDRAREPAGGARPRAWV